MGKDDSGVDVYPRVPIKKSSEGTTKTVRPGGNRKVLAGALVGGLIAGGAGGFVARPAVAPSPRIAELEDQVAAAQKAAKAAHDETDAVTKSKAESDLRADTLQHALDDANSSKTQLATRAADLEKKAKEIADVEAKLKVVIDKNGNVTTEGDEVHLQLVDKVLFKLNDDQLTDKGKALIAQVAAALKDVPDKQIYVQGHTDDQPIFIPPPPKPAPPPKKGTPPAPATPPPVRFTSNWELSAARALNVVHFLQDVGKIDPSRLAALAFGQYRPVSRTNKALNRRIEIVLYPKRAVVEKAPAPTAPAAPAKKP